MKCTEFKELLDAFIDDELDAVQRARMLEHAQTCESCAQALRQARTLKRVLAELDAAPVVPLPAQAAWRGAIKREEKRRKLRNVYRAVGAVAAAFVLLVSATFAMRGAGLLNQTAQTADSAVMSAAEQPRLYFGNVSSKDELPLAAALETDGEVAEESYDLDYAEDALASPKRAAIESDAEDAGEDAALASGASEGLDPDEARLLTRRATREIYTEDFDAAHARVSDLAEEYGGYLARDAVSSEAAGRVGELTVTVPQEDLDAFLDALDYIGDVTSGEVFTEDVTLSYYDAQGRLETLRAELDRLNALIPEAKDAAELAALNAQLDETYDRVDALEREVRAYTDEAGLARVEITLREGKAVAAITDTGAPGFGARMRGGFAGALASLRRFFADMAVSLAVLAPIAAVVLPVAAAIWILTAVLVKRHRRRVEQD